MPISRMNGVERPIARCASAISATVPPSPLLSSRISTKTYFTVTMRTSAQKISEMMPITSARVGPVTPRDMVQRFTEGVERAGADIAIDDADRAQGQAQEFAMRRAAMARMRCSA